MNDYDNLIDSLSDLQFPPLAPDNSGQALKHIIETNLLEYSKLIANLSKQLARLLNIDDHVNSIDNVNDESTFYLEICSFLKEFKCPYTCLLEGAIDERFKNPDNKLKLLEFLATELQASYILESNKSRQSHVTEDDFSSSKFNESEEAKALRRILITLGFTKPPSTVTIDEIWYKIETKCKELLSQVPAEYLGKPLLANNRLDEKQWLELAYINQALCDDFQMRRELLLTRLDVTIQSFKWADRLKKSNSEIANIYQQRRKELTTKQNVKVYYVLAARDDLCRQERTCSTRLMTKSRLHKIIIPKVPDRGGRTGELQPPPPEMPAFAQRKTSHHHAQPQRQQHNQGQRHDNNWSSNPRQQHQQYRPQSEYERFQNHDYNENSSRGSYRGGRGGGHGGRGGRGGGRRGGY